MKRICYGSILQVLYKNKATSIKQRHINGALLLLLDENYDLTDDNGAATKMGNGTSNINSDVAANASSLTYEDIIEDMRNTVISKLNPNKVILMVAALVDILSEDDSIDGDTIICSKTHQTKDDITAMIEFDPAWLLSVLFLYAVVNTTSDGYKNEIKEITSEYIDSLRAKAGHISLKKEIKTYTPQITKTLHDRTFNNVFTEVSHPASLQLTNFHALRVFHLNAANCRFTDRDLQKFLTSNIGRYVYSRAEMERFKVNDELETVGINAIRKLKEKESDEDLKTGNTLGNMLLYAFLEKVLNAPKLFSKIELNMRCGQYATKSDGIHLLAIDDGTGTPYHQLVFGASNIITDLQSAVDHALDCVQEISADTSDELKLVESTAFGLSFDDQTQQYLKDLILPRRNSVADMDQAFGIFIGYSIDINTAGMTNLQFRQEVDKKLAADASAIAPYITDAVKRRGMDSYSFYFYLLPFNNAEDDKKQIITDLLAGTGGAAI